MAEEMAHHLAELTDANVRAGMTPAEAALAARRAFGHVDSVKEQIRDQRSWAAVENTARDFRLTLRSLRRQPGFALVVILTLALGIGANTALFTVLNSVLLRPLPVADESRLVVLEEFQRDSSEGGFGVSYPDFADWRARSRSFASLALITRTGVIVQHEGRATRGVAAIVSGNLLTTLGVGAHLGRTFTPDDEHPVPKGAPVPVMLTHRAWQTRFGGDPGLIGRSVMIDERPSLVIGITPAGLFPVADEPFEFWFTTGINGSPDQTGATNASRNYRPYSALGRLAPGATLEKATAEIATITESLKQEHATLSRELAVRLMPLRERLTGDVRGQFILLFGIVGAVLLIACVNAANLLLARASSRQREGAIRSALGASQGDLLRPALTESFTLAFVGAAAGLLLSLWLVPLVAQQLPASIPRPTSFAPDTRVLLFTIGAALVTGLLCGLLPALTAARAKPADALKEGGRSGSGGGPAQRWREVLISAQVALALILLVGAGLLGRSLLQLHQVQPGFIVGNTLTAQLALTGDAYFKGDFDPGPINRFLDELTRQLSALPGVTHVSHAQSVPLTSVENSTLFEWEGAPTGQSVSTSAQLRFVDAAYFDTLGIPVRAGRAFSRDDRASAPAVAMVNEAFVRAHLRGENPLGRRIKLGWGGEAPKEIVGVVGDVRHRSLGDEARPEVYVPQAQFANASVTLLVRTSGQAEGLARELEAIVRSLDPLLPLTEVRTLEAYRNDTLAEPRFLTLLLGLFAALALTLTLVGLYGVTSYHVSQRTREIGIRLALGAGAGDIFQLVTREGMRPVLIGLVAGLLGAAIASQFLRSQLYGVSPFDVTTFVAIALLCTGAGILACLLPARRATRVDPMIALRCE